MMNGWKASNINYSKRNNRNKNLLDKEKKDTKGYDTKKKKKTTTTPTARKPMMMIFNLKPILLKIRTNPTTRDTPTWTWITGRTIIIVGMLVAGMDNNNNNGPKALCRCSSRSRNNNNNESTEEQLDPMVLRQMA